tara:strand:+ start:571 stop:1443 length:873 start_codon:yes stop_codon:yes gene_type:complete
MGLTKTQSGGLEDQSVSLDKLPHGTADSDGKFLRANNGADPTFESIPAGVGGSTGVDFNDNVKARFGTDNDLQIYHAGTNNVIDSKFNWLNITSDGGVAIRHEVQADGSDGENMALFKPDGAVELYYDNNKSLETTADGGVKAQGNYIVGTSGRGIQFNASDSGSSELLDDYEEGTHTTTVTISGNTSFSYSNRTLQYTKIGRAVHVVGRILMTGASSGSTFSFTLPFTNGNGVSFETSNNFQIIRGDTDRSFRIRTNESVASLETSSGSSTNTGASDPHINVNITYFTS